MAEGSCTNIAAVNGSFSAMTSGNRGIAGSGEQQQEKALQQSMLQRIRPY